MLKSPQLPEGDVEELQDLTSSTSHDEFNSTAKTPMPHRKTSSAGATESSKHQYTNLRSIFRSPTSHDPMQDPESSYGIQLAVSRVRHRLSGWEMGMILAVSADLAVLIFVLALTVFAAKDFPRNSNQATLIDDSCNSVQNWSTWLHLAVNAISTVLLATSSYVMQCLTSPTRKEINRAHSKGSCMDIGVPSFGNLLKTSPRRILLWMVILLSSLPIHLLANSAVYETSGANSYVLGVVEEEFISRPLSGLASTSYAYVGAGFDSVFYVSPTPSWVDKVKVTLGWNTTKLLKELVPKMERLENADCMRAYSQPLLSNRRSVIAVTSYKADIPANSSYNYINQLYYQSVDYCPGCESYRYYTDPSLWLCDFLHPQKNGPLVRGCNIPNAINRASEWTISGVPIEYCLSEEADGQCQLQADISIMIAVIVCAAVKIVTIMVAFWTMPKEIIATIGDVVASFLRDREPRTSDCCLLSRGDVHNHFPGRWKPGTTHSKPWSTGSLKKRLGSAAVCSSVARNNSFPWCSPAHHNRFLRDRTKQTRKCPSPRFKLRWNQCAHGHRLNHANGIRCCQCQLPRLAARYVI